MINNISRCAELSAHLEMLLFTCPFSPSSIFSSLLTLWSLGLKGFLSFLLLQFRELGFHLDDQHLELLFTLLAGVGVDIAGVLFTIGPFGELAPFEEVVVDLTDAAGTGAALAAYVGLEIGHSRLFRLGWGSFLPQL